jgi:hypothetical protein
MRAGWATKVVGLLVVVAPFPGTGLAQAVIDSDFSKGDFKALGWKAKGAWDVFSYPKETRNNPGPVARFPAQVGGVAVWRTRTATGVASQIGPSLTQRRVY